MRSSQKQEPGSVVVKRPEPGLARGAFEAPPWLFVVLAVAVFAGAIAIFGPRLRKRLGKNVKR